MTISKTDADALIRGFDSVADLIAGALVLDKGTGLKSSENLDQVYAALFSAFSSSGAIEPYAFANMVSSLQLAISRRHVTG